MCVDKSATCKEALDLLNKGGFDQVPVIDEQKKLLGLVTVGNLLSKVASARVSPKDEVTNAMFHFNTKRQFQEINQDTKLSDLERFFEKNAAAFVTARENGNLVVKNVVTKVDLLQWLFHSQ